MAYWVAFMHKIKAWLEAIGWRDYNVEIASEDASFRRYFRLQHSDKNYILMDSSLEKESLTPFLDVTGRLLASGVNAPNIIEQNLDDGFLIIEDFGSVHYLDILDESNYKDLYIKAIKTIVNMQASDARGLPIYDKAFLRFEMELMQEWFLEKYLKLSLSDEQKKLIDETLDSIADVVLSQPQNLFVHRDYHSRNMLLTPADQLGVIDYQDAMSGALTYDLVSLLKDCYITHERSEIEKLALQFRNLKRLDVDDATFLRWFDFMGLQRHIKVLGVFARLYLRDGKDGYLNDLPLTLKYVLEAGERYEETRELTALLKGIKLP
ncbi:MAG: phosphotransferase [Campylobacterota bacterium]|nr:phosphotransferase [Campylobacterota bacterium]